MNHNLRVFLIYEVLGKPAEHIKTALSEFIDKIGQNKGVIIKSKKIMEPKTVEESDLFSTYAEVEAEIDNMGLMFDLVLNTLPSHIEVLTPEDLHLKNFEISSLMSDLTIKMHRYDELAKSLGIERENLISQVKVLEEKVKTLEKKENKIEKKK